MWNLWSKFISHYERLIIWSWRATRAMIVICWMENSFDPKISYWKLKHPIKATIKCVFCFNFKEFQYVFQEKNEILYIYKICIIRKHILHAHPVNEHKEHVQWEQTNTMHSQLQLHFQGYHFTYFLLKFRAKRVKSVHLDFF